MKKILSIILVLIVLTLVFIGCSNSEIKKEDFSSDIKSEITSSYTDDNDDTELFIDTVQPMLFKCENSDGNIMYLMGTVHIDGEKNSKIIEEVKEYLLDCDALAVEFDVVAYKKDLVQQMNDVQIFMLNGMTIKDIMPTELYEKSVQFLKDNSAYSIYYESYNLAMWNELVMQVMYDKANIPLENGIDTRLINTAYDNDIPVLDIESSTLQYEAMNSVSDEYYLYAIDEMLDYDVNDLIDDINELYTAYTSGDIDEFSDLYNNEIEGDEMTPEYIAVYEAEEKIMIQDRNDGMFKKALEYFSEGKKVFFAVGCAHLIGDNGLISQLENNGYTVSQLIFK